MTRLTKQIREKMVNDLLIRRFKERGEALAQAAGDLFATVYDHAYDVETRRLMTKLQARAREAFRHYDAIDCRTSIGRVPVGRVAVGASPILWRAIVESRPFLDTDRHHDSRWTYVDGPIAAQIVAFANAQVAFTNEIKAAKAEALGALSTVTTVKQLTELWPEAMPILGKHIPMSQGSNLPAVQFAKLTEAFGLGATQ